MPATTTRTNVPAKASEVTRVVKFCINQKALTAHQRDLIDRHAGTHRAVWNWGLSNYNKRERAVRTLVREAAGTEAITRHGSDDREHVQAVYADADWRKAAFADAKIRVPSTLPLTGKPITRNGLDAEFTQLAQTNTPYDYDRDGNPKTFGWWEAEKKEHGVSRNAVNQPLAALESAVKDYYSGKSKRGNKKRKDHMPSGWPTFKKKRDPGQFSILKLSNGGDCPGKILRAPAGSGRRLNIPKLGFVPVHNDLRRLRRYIAKGGTPKSARFTQVADRWYVSINVSFDADNPYVAAPAGSSARQRKNGPVGVDRGVNVLAALSTGEMRDGLQPAKEAQRRKNALQRRAAKAQRGSNRHKALTRRIAHLDHMVALKRSTALHHLSKELTTRFDTVVVEDLKLVSMTASVAPKPDPDKPGHFLKNGKRRKAGLNRSMLDAALGELHRQLTYKSARHGSTVATVNPAYTSQACSDCDLIDSKNRKSQAVFECVSCGFTCNADVNAAINIIKRHLRQAGTPWETMVGLVTEVQLSRRDRSREEQRCSQTGQPVQTLAALRREDLRGGSNATPPTTRSLDGGSGQPENPHTLQETA